MASLSAFHIFISAVLLLLTTSFLRLLYILPSSRPRAKPHAKHSTSHMVVVLGSGGHTAEMMSLLRDIDPKRYFRRTYIVSSGDDFSSGKAFEIEKHIQSRYSSSRPSKPGVVDLDTGSWDLKTVPRARKVHQPLYTTPFSSLWCLIGCFRVLYKSSLQSSTSSPEYPDVIITNGPATAVMMILAATVLKFVAVAPSWKMKTIYVESWARVKTLSLSGKLLLRMGICDKFIVQWEALAKAIGDNRAGRNVEWVGFLVD